METKTWSDFWLFKPVKDLYNSLFASDGGFSFRKLGAAFGIFYIAAKLSLSVVDEKIKYDLVLVWLVFAAVCIGLVTIPDLIKFISTSKTTPPTNQDAPPANGAPPPPTT